MTDSQAIPDKPKPDGGRTSWDDAAADPVSWLEIAAEAARDDDHAKALDAAGRALQLDWPPRQPAAQGDDGAAGTAQLEDLTLGFLRDAAGQGTAADRTLGVLRALVHLQLDQPEEAVHAIDEALRRDANADSQTRLIRRWGFLGRAGERLGLLSSGTWSAPD
jgi:hypothetical protein